MSSSMTVDINGLILAWCIVGMVAVVFLGLAAAAMVKWMKSWTLGR